MAPMRRRVTPGGNYLRQVNSPAGLQPLFTVVMLEKPILQHMIRIPTKFAMIFGEKLPEVATLAVPDGRIWRVRLKKEKERTWLLDGLKDFITYYSIHYGYILQFIYQGSSEFSVRICDAMGSEIDYPFHGPTRSNKEPNLDNHNKDTPDDDRSVEILDSKPPFSHGFPDKHKEHPKDDDDSIEIVDIKPPTSHSYSSKRKAFNTGRVEQKSFEKSQNVVSSRKRGRPKKQDRSDAAPMDDPSPSVKRSKPIESYNKSRSREEDTEMLVSRTLSFIESKRLVMSKETEKAARAATMSKLENPSFMVILQPYNLNCSFVHVPAQFARRHNLMNRHSKDIQLKAHNEEKKWPAKCTFTSSRVRIRQGWGPFSASKHLKEGDVCVFELISEVKEILLKVWIYRPTD